MHTTACLVVTPNAKSWVVKSTRLEFIDFIGSNSNWLTEHTEPVDWERLDCFSHSLRQLGASGCSLSPLAWPGISWFRDRKRLPECNATSHSRFPKKTFEDFSFISIYIWSYKQIFAKILNTLGISARIRRDCLASNSLWCSHWPGHPILVMYPSVNGVTVEWVCIVWIIKTYQNKKSSLAIWILLLHGFNRILCCVCNHIGSHTRTQNCDVQTHSGLWCCACGKGLAPDVY